MSKKLLLTLLILGVIAISGYILNENISYIDNADNPYNKTIISIWDTSSIPNMTINKKIVNQLTAYIDDYKINVIYDLRCPDDITKKCYGFYDDENKTINIISNFDIDFTREICNHEYCHSINDFENETLEEEYCTKQEKYNYTICTKFYELIK